MYFTFSLYQVLRTVKPFVNFFHCLTELYKIIIIWAATIYSQQIKITCNEKRWLNYVLDFLCKEKKTKRHRLRGMMNERF